MPVANTPSSLQPNGTSPQLDRGISQVFTWNATTQFPAFQQIDVYDIRYRIGAGAFTTLTAQAAVGNPSYPNWKHTWAPNTFAGGTTYGWQVRVHSAWDNNYSSWSSEAFFTSAVTPTAAVITSPTPAQVITTYTHNVTWTLTTQATYRLRVLIAGVAEYDSGVIGNTILRAHVVTLPANGARTIELSVQNVAGGPTIITNVAVTVNWVLPATPSTVTGTMTDAATVGVRHHLSATSTHPAPAGGQPAIASVDYYARKVGDPGVGSYIGTSTAGAGVAWALNYERLPQGSWQIAAIAVSADLRRSILSAWTTFSVQPNLTGCVLSDPTDMFTVFYGANNDSGSEVVVSEASSLMRYVGRKSPVLEFGVLPITAANPGGLVEDRTVTVSKVQVETADATVVMRALERLVESHKPVVYRDKRGRRIIGLLTVESIRDRYWGYEIGLSVQETDYSADIFQWDPLWP